MLAKIKAFLSGPGLCPAPGFDHYDDAEGYRTGVPAYMRAGFRPQPLPDGTYLTGAASVIRTYPADWTPSTGFLEAQIAALNMAVEYKIAA